MAKTTAAVIKGTFIRPGTSKNKRGYTAENIGKAVARMQETIDSPEGLPITMFTSHGEANKDNGTHKVGRVTKVAQRPDGSAYWEAEIANTEKGRDMANLVVGGYSKGVSIRGGWMAPTKIVEDESGHRVETAEDMAIVGIDFTDRPGVTGAAVESAYFVESYDDGMGEVFTESVDDFEITNIFDEEDKDEDSDARIREAVEFAMASLDENAKPAKVGEKFAANYNGKKSFPIDSADKVRSSWSSLSLQESNSDYTPAQLARIKSKIKKAAKGFGFDVQEEHQNFVTDLEEVLEGYVSMTISNGDSSIAVSGYSPPAQLHATALRIAAAATKSLNSLDPNADGDIDVPGGDGEEESTSESTAIAEASKCLACEGAIDPADAYCSSCGAPVPNAESTDTAENQNNKEGVEMTAENTNNDASTLESAANTLATPPVVAPIVDREAVKAAVQEALAAMKKQEAEDQAIAIAEAEATAKAAAEAEAAALAESASKEEFKKTIAEAIAEAVAAVKAADIQEARSNGAPRKGYVFPSTFDEDGKLRPDVELNESELSKMDRTSFQQVAAGVWENDPRFASLFAKADALRGE